MARQPISLAVVGAEYPTDRAAGRKAEIARCYRGEPVQLRRERRPFRDGPALGVYSARGEQIGLIRGGDVQRVGADLEAVRAAFQCPDTFGAVIRLGFDGSAPVVPPTKRKRPKRLPSDWPPPSPRDEFANM